MLGETLVDSHFWVKFKRFYFSSLHTTENRFFSWSEIRFGRRKGSFDCWNFRSLSNLLHTCLFVIICRVQLRRVKKFFSQQLQIYWRNVLLVSETKLVKLNKEFLSMRPCLCTCSGNYMLLDFRPFFSVEFECFNKEVMFLSSPPTVLLILGLRILYDTPFTLSSLLSRSYFYWILGTHLQRQILL